MASSNSINASVDPASMVTYLTGPIFSNACWTTASSVPAVIPATRTIRLITSIRASRGRSFSRLQVEA